MKKITGIALSLALVTVPAGQALAGWKLVSPAKPATIGKSTLSVTAGEEWNRNTYRPIKKGELWTLDGLGLNELYFVTGLVAGEPLYRELDKKNKPLPKLGKAMQLTDIPDFFESSQRVALNTSLWWVWLAWMAFVAACHVQVQIEEAHLRASFGDAYCDFASSTPRWIGIAR